MPKKKFVRVIPVGEITPETIIEVKELTFKHGQPEVKGEWLEKIDITFEHFLERAMNGEWLKGVMAVRLVFEDRGNFIASGADLLVVEETLEIIGGRWWHNINQTMCTACGKSFKGHKDCNGFEYYGRKHWSGRGEVFTPDISIWKDFYPLK